MSLTPVREGTLTASVLLPHAAALAATLVMARQNSTRSNHSNPLEPDRGGVSRNAPEREVLVLRFHQAFDKGAIRRARA